MPVIAENKPDLVKEVRLQVGKDWHHVSWETPVERKYAVERAMVILRAMGGENTNAD